MTNGEAIDRIREHMAIHKLNEPRAVKITEALNMAIEALKEQPKKGKWIPVTNGRGGNECSLCHNYASSYQNGQEYLSKYCPNCGADMRGEQECQ